VTSPTFSQIASISLRDRVVSALKDAFFSGQIRPGDQIVERQLAQQMKIGTPAIREALISLEEQGFVRRVRNTATYATEFNADEVRQLYTLRIELELLALQWAKPRVTPADLLELEGLIDALEAAGASGDRRGFLECDHRFHSQCWRLSGNSFLVESLERLMPPLFAFVVLASGAPLTVAMAREHRTLVHALRDLREPAFSAAVRGVFNGFAFRWIAAMGK
jgi:DNA-binding GntR family transcriptional regulator